MKAYKIEVEKWAGVNKYKSVDRAYENFKDDALIKLFELEREYRRHSGFCGRVIVKNTTTGRVINSVEVHS